MASSTGVWGSNVNRLGADVMRSETIRWVDFEGVETKTRWEEETTSAEKELHCCCCMMDIINSRELRIFVIVGVFVIINRLNCNVLLGLAVS